VVADLRAQLTEAEEKWQHWEKKHDRIVGALSDEITTSRNLQREIERLRSGDIFCEHKVADAFWKYWRENGETHKHGYYESTWGAIRAALRTALATQPENERLREAAEPFAELPPIDAMCHKGIVEQEECCHCGPIIKLRTALAAQPEDKKAERD
jgi:hypothetical protein